LKTFQNKVAVITGAGSGMGRYLALNLAQEGCNVAICDINTSSLKETEELIKNYNISCSTHNLDLRDKNNIDILVKRLANNSKRPILLNTNIKKKIKELDTKRRNFYLILIKILSLNLSKYSCLFSFLNPQLSGNLIVRQSLLKLV